MAEGVRIIELVPANVEDLRDDDRIGIDGPTQGTRKVGFGTLLHRFGSDVPAGDPALAASAVLLVVAEGRVFSIPVDDASGGLVQALRGELTEAVSAQVDLINDQIEGIDDVRALVEAVAYTPPGAMTPDGRRGVQHYLDQAEKVARLAPNMPVAEWVTTAGEFVIAPEHLGHAIVFAQSDADPCTVRLNPGVHRVPAANGKPSLAFVEVIRLGGPVIVAVGASALLPPTTAAWAVLRWRDESPTAGPQTLDITFPEAPAGATRRFTVLLAALFDRSVAAAGPRDATLTGQLVKIPTGAVSSLTFVPRQAETSVEAWNSDDDPVTCLSWDASMGASDLPQDIEAQLVVSDGLRAAVAVLFVHADVGASASHGGASDGEDAGLGQVVPIVVAGQPENSLVALAWFARGTGALPGGAEAVGSSPGITVLDSGHTGGDDDLNDLAYVVGVAPVGAAGGTWEATFARNVAWGRLYRALTGPLDPIVPVLHAPAGLLGVKPAHAHVFLHSDGKTFMADD